MWKYLKLHERFVVSALAGQRGNVPLAELKAFHERQIRYMQHERMVHLIATLFVATYLLLAIGFVVAMPVWPGFVLVAVLFGLASIYLVHYFHLENGIQRWYYLANRIDERLGLVYPRDEQSLSKGLF
jgi:hypothetical protein